MFQNLVQTERFVDPESAAVVIVEPQSHAWDSISMAVRASNTVVDKM